MPNPSVLSRAALLAPLICRRISSVVKNASWQSPVQKTSLVYLQAALLEFPAGPEACGLG